jgi:hypothetical protein
MLVINVFPSSAIVPGRPIYTYWYISGIVVETKNNLKQYTMKHVQMEGFCVRDRQNGDSVNLHQVHSKSKGWKTK